MTFESTNDSEGERPLAGIRVLDFTAIISGPYCTRILADMGAEVIKVEPLEGDHIRIRHPMRGAHSNVFGHLNAGKKSVQLDLKCKAGRDAALGLARRADVFVENWRPGVADRLGLGFAEISKHNSRIVYCSLSGFGQRGPSAHRPAYAPIVHAASGFDVALGATEKGAAPASTSIFIADVFGGMSAVAAIQTSLFRRERTGKGQYIDLSLVDCMFNVLVHECQQAQTPASKRTRYYRPLRASDGYIVVAPTTQKNFQHLAFALNQMQLLSDPRFGESRAREANWSLLMEIVEQWASTRTADDCERILLAAGVPCARYKDISEAMSDPQTQARGSLAQVRDGAGVYWVFNPPFQMPGLATTVGSRVPELGEDTDEVLGGLLGYTRAQVSECSGRKEA